MMTPELEQRYKQSKIKFIKSVYGEEARAEDRTVEFMNKIIVAWSLIGLPTLKDLEQAHTDDEILSFHQQISKANGLYN